MKPIVQIKSISEINRFVKGVTKHPLVAVVDFSKLDEHIDEDIRVSCDFYSIMFKNYCANKIRYGRQTYDFQEGSLVCIAPRLVLTMDSEIEKKDDMIGWGLFFHPDLVRGTSLGDKMKDYTFFSYETAEALHLSEKEKQTLFDCILKIQTELEENIDNHSQTLIVSNIELLLNYCSRYYGRQFITRKNSNKDVVSQVKTLLKEYFTTDGLSDKGLPTVKYLAEMVHLSPNYLSDLLKKETGMNTQDHIHYFLIEEAKNILLNSDASVSEIAYALGFEYPQYFSKLFKQKTGTTPQEFRNLN
ncbi:AraC-like DNA-binding protein [Dyadobacter sp. BE34]|uniref:AraC-like DNA-binding protein n=1 Tax=Dyadobacter fermentans TaxID=94254 RepID=A0ABU1QWB7_9BACT|nr:MULTISPECIES: helix-turn-helix transcriptional regulator [Dyadobacter]MDR6804595.1 AraC-like DNA-binding protein [Dyadobacter fermentans]MDR7043646.1 AraC-like DNA-binding protein [Dyadobacter sp. BE242]MDR7197958.1 AraC-like DNA-binding protein [Dyadobacter sp. BE34]MDR7214609.1 AraC-like DNA-binding protein [Dyadobacter sp. BE31]MDR7262144.1 AraC-like DNA-binding protein [Dyadobacter sp. BE32]